MGKNVVICCDGTGNEFGTHNSNVIKLFTTLVNNPKTQVAYYDPGIGTMGANNALLSTSKWFTKVLGLAFGYGLLDNVGDAYRFLMENWEPGDQLYIFGFSRGAYTARVLAAMIYMFGLLPRDNEQLIPYILRSLKQMDQAGLELAIQFKKVFSSFDCKPHFVGVWDTVNSVGWITDPLTVPFTKNNPDIHIGRHAVSIDERRCFFRQNLWGAPSATQDYKQVWFAGVHSDIGGGYAEPDSGLSKVTLEWMLVEAKAAGLIMDPDLVDQVLGRSAASPYAPVNASGKIHNSLCGAWKILEWIPRRHWNPTLTPPRNEWILYRKRPRTMPENSVIHQAVLDRLNDPKTNYHPPNLAKKYSVEPWSAGRSLTAGQP